MCGGGKYPSLGLLAEESNFFGALIDFAADMKIHNVALQKKKIE